MSLRRPEAGDGRLGEAAAVVEQRAAGERGAADLGGEEGGGAQAEDVHVAVELAAGVRDDQAHRRGGVVAERLDVGDEARDRQRGRRCGDAAPTSARPRHRSAVSTSAPARTIDERPQRPDRGGEAELLHPVRDEHAERHQGQGQRDEDEGDGRADADGGAAAAAATVRAAACHAARRGRRAEAPVCRGGRWAAASAGAPVVAGGAECGRGSGPPRARWRTGAPVVGGGGATRGPGERGADQDRPDEHDRASPRTR